jgi:hypothetical protein
LLKNATKPHETTDFFVLLTYLVKNEIFRSKPQGQFGVKQRSKIPASLKNPGRLKGPIPGTFIVKSQQISGLPGNAGKQILEVGQKLQEVGRN